MDLGEMPLNAHVFHAITDAQHILRYGRGEAALQIDTNRKNILATMRHFESVDIIELADFMHVDRDVIAGHFADLDAEGLVEAADGDRRRLTDEGWVVADAIMNAEMSISNEFIDAIDDDKKHELIDILETMVNAWNE